MPLLPAPLWATPAIAPGNLAQAQEAFRAADYARVAQLLSEADIQKLRRAQRPEAYLLLGLSHLQRGQTDQSLGVFQLAAGLYPKDLNLLSRLAEVLHGVELDDRARAVYQRVLKIHPNNAAANLGLAEIYHSQGLLKRSAAHYERCIAEWGENPKIWRDFAGVLAELRDYGRAAKAIEKALVLDPGNAESLRALADFQYRLGLRSQAQRTMEQALALAPRKPEVRLQYALRALESQDLDLSLAQAEEGLRQDPEDPLALWIRGVIRARRGKTDEAMGDLQRAASRSRQAPFVAAAAEALLKEIRR